MKKVLAVQLFLFLMLPQLSFAQLSVSGDITPSAMLRIGDGSLINLPFRMGNIAVDYSIGDFEFKTTTALETRWQDAEYDVDMLQFREAYVLWYPSFGEIKLGKMIQAWGAADANNPTDNLSPYDFYYMFMAGTDRKLGSLSANVKFYLSDFQLEVVGLPEFTANRMPLNEPDFPIQIDIPENTNYFKPVTDFEYGARLQYAMDLGDISASYFNGNDRGFSPAGVEIDMAPMMQGLAPDFVNHLCYRSTDVIGLDAVIFPGDWTMRGEFAYFRTKTPEIDYSMSKLTYDANYLQSIVQVEYAFANGVQLMGQFINTEYLKTESTFTKDVNFIGLEALAQDTSYHALDPVRDQLLLQLASVSNLPFSAGMGTPFAMISERVFIISSMIEMLDNSLELNSMIMANLKETGYMGSFGSSYALLEGLNLNTSLAYFIGGDEEGNSFKELEDFSNLSIGLTYSF